MNEPWALAVTALEAPAEVRARLAAEFARNDDLRGRTFLLSTCHRVELYGVGARPAAVAPAITGAAAVRRLHRVAAGLESASLGEDEVLHQVRDAFAAAVRSGLTDGRIQRLVQTAIATGRRARAHGRARSRSLEARAVDWLVELAAPARVLVVGAGQVGRGLAREAEARAIECAVATRRPLAGQLDLRTAAELAPGFDGILVALAGRWEVAPDCLPPVADLSSPGALPERTVVHLGDRHLGIDELFKVRSEDAAYARRAEALVERAVEEYEWWLESRTAVTA